MDVGEAVGPYVLERALGSGGSADVWLATHQTLNDVRALKIVTRSSRCIRERTVREARALAACRSDNVVGIHDIFTQNGQPVIVQEFVDGPSLELWGQSGPEVHAVRQVLHQILQGIGALHDCGIVHRDLKPSNILLTRDGRVVLIDLGLAKDLTGTLAGDPTRTGSFMGTPAFMAPEQAIDATDVDRRTDLYAVGVVAAFLLTGESPFGRSTIRETLNAVDDCDVGIEAFIERHDLEAIPDLCALIRQTVVHDPAGRLENWRGAIDLLSTDGDSILPIDVTVDLDALGAPQNQGRLDATPKAAPLTTLLEEAERKGSAQPFGVSLDTSGPQTSHSVHPRVLQVAGFGLAAVVGGWCALLLLGGVGVVAFAPTASAVTVQASHQPVAPSFQPAVPVIGASGESEDVRVAPRSSRPAKQGLFDKLFGRK